MKIYFVLFSLFGCLSLQAQVKDTVITKDTVAIKDVITTKDTITVIGVGDIMMGSNYPDGSGLPLNDGLDLMKDVEPILKNADVTIGNLEGVLLDQGGYAKTCHNPKVCYVFRSPERYVQNLVNAGFDALSLANNHAGDFGAVGMQSSIRTLDTAGLYHAGQTANPFAIFEKEGIKYGFIAFAPNTGCNNINDLFAAKKMVAHLDSISDIVIVSFHGGAEGPEHQHVPRKNELFYGENRGNVYQFAHAVIDAGADIVFGHGPHVTRAVELYKDKFIAYSLGNFCTYGGINVSGINGLAPIVKVFTDKKGFFLKANVTSTQQSFLSSVKLDFENKVLKKIQELTKTDFPEGELSIDNVGWIMKSTK
jgi:poly-gamma-glutamate capsule biosynthesis protein CapA/YwtB (metallophosphatase superfamily)